VADRYIISNAPRLAPASLLARSLAIYIARMPIIGFLAQKGGAGKTTLAVHLAVLAGDALLVDLDPQRSAAEWWESREAELPELAVGEARDLSKALERFAYQLGQA